LTKYGTMKHVTSFNSNSGQSPVIDVVSRKSGVRMARSFPVATAISVTVGLLFAVFGSSTYAEDLRPRADRVEIESNLSLTSLSTYYGDLSVTYSPFARFYESGLKFRVAVSESLYKYPLDVARTTFAKGLDTQVDFLIGYGIAFDRWYLLAMAGPSVLWSVQKPEDSSASSSTVTGALKGVVSLYGLPTDHSMFFGQASYSTPNNSYYLQAKVGAAITPPIFFGPEVTLAGRLNFDPALTGFDQAKGSYDQAKVGLFVSGLHLGHLQLGVSSGFLHDRQQGNGAYGSMTARIEF
jgi:cellulose biosynthesis protein BcsS